MENKKIKVIRIVIAIIFIALIVFMWVRKDIVGIYTSMSAGDALPLVITSIVVTIAKVAIVTGVVLFAKWLIKKITINKQSHSKSNIEAVEEGKENK